MTSVETSVLRVPDGTRLLRHTFSAFRFGTIDPTVHLDGGRLVMASMTPVGPAWIAATASNVTFGGVGVHVIRQRHPDPLGTNDSFVSLESAHPIVSRLQHDFGGLRIGSSGDVYKAALTATLGQRITAAEAVNQWARLCRAFPNPVETPTGIMLAPPDPTRLAEVVPYQLHTLGIEEARARTLIAIARVFRRPGQHHSDPQAALRRLVAEVPRFGPWTRALVEAEALGNPDAVAVGDFHLKNVVAHALNGRPRGTDDEMLAALAPYAGNRGRVLSWLALGGIAAPKFGPRRRNIDFRRF
ncbi:MAG: DNA-3-methyladenine glycosylase family protein [Ilumatobacteraceae bacterium]